MSGVSGALNFRDVGGLRAAGGITRHGVLLRSGHLARLDADGGAALRALGIRRIVDLRSGEEVAFEPSRVDLIGLSELETVRAPLFAGSTASFFDADVTLEDMYRTILTEAPQAIVAAVATIARHAPVLVHCTVGKDRTGVTVALALAAAGVDEDEIVADYARTEAALPAGRNERVLAYLRSAHPGAVNLEALATRSPAPVMRGLLAEVTRDFGGAAGFLTAHGLPEDDLARLRDVLIAPDGTAGT
ncbi:tyrosine-protein phosphatase [Microbacterium telephonicum]|uniref:Protein-tyrosine phosphatase n=1 Tax=Microbacterium telephonicum TaxID=1714841 RepID=A0A498BXR1_9MICO|nr:tyrosine-protein phosphatase [Microbacterium telephonicum]RLK47677.1 protein-tyrosine phosphatase [Microbacterium telephonicum]